MFQFANSLEPDQFDQLTRFVDELAKQSLGLFSSIDDALTIRREFFLARDASFIGVFADRAEEVGHPLAWIWRAAYRNHARLGTTQITEHADICSWLLAGDPIVLTQGMLWSLSSTGEVVVRIGWQTEVLTHRTASADELSELLARYAARETEIPIPRRPNIEVRAPWDRPTRQDILPARIWRVRPELYYLPGPAGEMLPVTICYVLDERPR